MRNTHLSLTLSRLELVAVSPLSCSVEQKSELNDGKLAIGRLSAVFGTVQ